MPNAPHNPVYVQDIAAYNEHSLVVGMVAGTDT